MHAPPPIVLVLGLLLAGTAGLLAVRQVVRRLVYARKLKEFLLTGETDSQCAVHFGTAVELDPSMCGQVEDAVEDFLRRNRMLFIRSKLGFCAFVTSALGLPIKLVISSGVSSSGARLVTINAYDQYYSAALSNWLIARLQKKMEALCRSVAELCARTGAGRSDCEAVWGGDVWPVRLPRIELRLRRMFLASAIGAIAYSGAILYMLHVSNRMTMIAVRQILLVYAMGLVFVVVAIAVGLICLGGMKKGMPTEQNTRRPVFRDGSGRLP
jgi:hypothetical protein